MAQSSLEAYLKPYRDNRDYVDARIKAGVEQHRKRFGEVRVTDGQGNPLPGARVLLRQKSHDFSLGANLFMLDEFECGEKNAEYRRLFPTVFNLATLPFYWRDLEPVKGQPRYAKDSPRVYRRPAPDLCLEYCEEAGITPKAHCLNYEQWDPDWIPRDSVQHVKEALEEHFAELGARYAHRIHCWEVTNEVNIPAGMLPHHTPFIDEDDFISWSFDTARRYFPRNELMINEATSKTLWEIYGELPDYMRRRFHGSRSLYYMMLDRELRSGTKIDAIGIQYHMFMPREKMISGAQTLCDPVYLYDVMDKYSDFHLPLQITETTLSAFSNLPGDEEVQAELLTMLYSVFFSHPSMEAVIYWNLVDGYAAGAPRGDMTAGENTYHGGLVRFDMTPKPAYYALRDLFHKTYHTEADVLTGEDGSARFRGFTGQYEAEILCGGRRTTQALHLSRDGLNRFNLVLQEE